MLYLGSDHRGFELKNKIMKHLETLGEDYTDLGYFEKEEDDDYNEISKDVSQYVRLKTEHKGVLFCGTGIGVSIVSNKHKDIRSALCFNVETAKLAREHEACNIMCIPADYVDFDTAKEMVTTFLQTPFSMADRHLRRLNKILELEKEGLV